MKKNPYFSVILPTFNSGQTLNRTLLSLALQTFKNFELIIIDDCSDDINTITNIIHSFNKKLNYKFIKHKKNKNGAAARNTGIKHAIGKFICFIDSDDTWDIERLQYLNLFILKNKISEYTIIYGKVRIIRDKNSFIEYKPYSEFKAHQNLSEYLFCYGGIMQTSTLVISRKSIRDLKFDERFTRHQDVTLVLEAFSKGFSFKYISKPLVSYIVPRTVLKKRITDNRISIEFCDYWLKCMDGNLSKKSILGYNYYVKSRIQILSSKYIYIFKYILSIFLCFDIKFIFFIFLDFINRIQIYLKKN